MPEFTLTKHAIQRALDMAVDGDEIRDCMTRPRNINQSRSHPDTYYITRGRITLVIGDGGAVVTILWANAAAYQTDIDRGVYGARDGSKAYQARMVAKARKRNR